MDPRPAGLVGRRKQQALAIPVKSPQLALPGARDVRGSEVPLALCPLYTRGMPRPATPGAFPLCQILGRRISVARQKTSGAKMSRREQRTEPLAGGGKGSKRWASLPAGRRSMRIAKVPQNL